MKEATMENCQTFSYRLLYEMEPMFIASLHLNNDNLERVAWENTKISDSGSLLGMLLNMLKMGMF